MAITRAGAGRNLTFIIYSSATCLKQNFIYSCESGMGRIHLISIRMRIRILLFSMNVNTNANTHKSRVFECEYEYIAKYS